MKRRSQIESELAQLQRSIDRVWDDYLRERERERERERREREFRGTWRVPNSAN
jgi:hypothetical protein